MNKTQAGLNIEEVKRVKHDSGPTQNKKTTSLKGGVSNEKPTVNGGKKPATRKGKQQLVGSNSVSTSSARQNGPKRRIQVYTDSEPLITADDEDDELLLTSKGWDWDPQ
jgi:hypothetical protein